MMPQELTPEEMEWAEEMARESGAPLEVPASAVWFARRAEEIMPKPPPGFVLLLSETHGRLAALATKNGRDVWEIALLLLDALKAAMPQDRKIEE